MTMSHKIKDAVPQQWEVVGAVVSIGNSRFLLIYFFYIMPQVNKINGVQV